MAKRLKHSIVKTLPVNIIPEHIYLLDNNDGTYTQYVSDENSVLRVAKDASGVIVVQGGDNVQVDNTDPSSPIINVDLSNYSKVSVSSSDDSIEINHIGDNYDIKAKHSVKGVVAGEGIDINSTLPETPVIGLKMKSPDGSVEIGDEDGYKTFKVPVQDISGKANKDATDLTEEDKVAWKEALGVTDVIEKDTLQTVTDRGNETTNPIRISRNYVDSQGVEKKTSVTIALTGNSDDSVSNLLITNFREDFQEKNKDSLHRNTLIGRGNAHGLVNSDRNTLVGFNALSGNTSDHTYTLTGNTIIGCGNVNYAPKLSLNTIIGSNNRIFNGNYVTPPDTAYYPIWGNLINGDYTNNAWGSYYGSGWNSERYKTHLKDSLKITDENGYVGPFHNTVIGNGIKLAIGTYSVNAYQNIWIGSNVLNAGFAYKFVGNIFMGNEIYPEHNLDRPAGAIVIGNYLKISGRHTLGELAIHNSTHQPTNWNDALIRGNFNTRYLKINGKFIINPQYAEPFNPEVFTKQVVAKPDGTTTLADLPVRPQVKILREDYTPTENLEYLDTFTFNLKANTTYKLELGILGDERILSQCIITDDIGYLSVSSRYLLDLSGGWGLHIGTEEELQQRDLFNSGLSYNNTSSLLNFVIRPKSNCYIKIPVKRFSTVPTTSKLLVGTYMKLEPII